MMQLLDYKMILKAALAALVFIFIIGIFDLYDLVGGPLINDIFQESEGFRGRPGNENGKIINYIFTWITLYLC